MSDLIIHDDGVYVGLPMHDYLADPALGSSSIKKLAANPPDAMWERPGNPLWDEPESQARALGTLIHVAVLDGIKAFDAQFTCEPDRAAYPGALETNDDLKNWMRENGVKPLTGAKAELIERIKASGLVEPPIWADIVAQTIGGRTAISAKADRYVRLVQSLVSTAPDMAALFSGGLAEVSLFWTIEHNGKRIRCKARPDYLRADGIADLKKFGQAPRFGRDLQSHLQSEAANYGYPVQAVWHLRGLAALHDAPMVSASSQALCDLTAELVMAPGERGFTWVFVRTPGAPCAMALDFARADAFGNPDPAWEHAESVIAKALDNYVEYSTRFGDGLWLRVEPRRPCASHCWPLWMQSEDNAEITV
ncbi:MAG TPA: hypothetical protein VG735_07855 [Caulobacterales bacterium]|nr:hypothetical protein [Caulobacterales bacterium]